ncbi:MAG: winged helix-turn-helix transcriptional regulator [Halobacteria archaeon]
MTDVADFILEYVEINPGMHFSGILREIDVASGQLQYHLRNLSEEGEVESEKVAGMRHYFPEDFGKKERVKLSLLRRETKRDVVVGLLGCDGRSPGDLARELGLARSTLEHHLADLEEPGLVERRYVDGRVYLEPGDDEEITRLLETIDPSLLDRSTDRFTRLFDGFFDEF